jgi:hypothetical protein
MSNIRSGTFQPPEVPMSWRWRETGRDVDWAEGPIMLKCGNECPFSQQQLHVPSVPLLSAWESCVETDYQLPLLRTQMSRSFTQVHCGPTRNFHSKRNIQLTSAVPDISYCINFQVGNKRLDSNWHFVKRKYGGRAPRLPTLTSRVEK